MPESWLEFAERAYKSPIKQNHPNINNKKALIRKKQECDFSA